MICLFHLKLLLQFSNNGARQFERIRRHQNEMDLFEIHQKLTLRVNHTAIFKIAHHDNGEIFQASQSTPNGKQIQESLGGMITGTVSRIHHRNAASFRQVRHTSGFGMSHGDNIGQLRNDSASVI